ncbi:MAG: hypothetical protein HW385_214, partial [candidate division NC10 bacterium]|nr:hypothetical protein [candidate division NC10 bacterium]
MKVQMSWISSLQNKRLPLLVKLAALITLAICLTTA